MLVGSNDIKTIKNILMLDLFLTNMYISLHKALTDLCGLLMDYCEVCIRCLDSHSDGTHSLRRIHW